MSKLIAVIDGSVYSASVCEHAAWVAGIADAEVEVLHVLSRAEGRSDAADLSGSIGLGARSALLGELAEIDAHRARLAQKRGRAILEDAEALLSELGVGQVHVRLRHDELVDAVHDLEDDAELVVIGKRGESANFQTLHIGANLERVARATRRPLLVAARSFSKPEKVLLAFDGGTSVMKAIEFFANHHRFNHLPVHLLSVGRDAASDRRALEGAVATLSGSGYTASCESLPGTPESVIAGKVENEGYDLLIMGAYGHSRIRNLIIGSTTTEMIRSCKVPVLLFR